MRVVLCVIGRVAHVVSRQTVKWVGLSREEMVGGGAAGSCEDGGSFGGTWRVRVMVVGLIARVLWWRTHCYGR